MGEAKICRGFLTEPKSMNPAPEYFLVYVLQQCSRHVWRLQTNKSRRIILSQPHNPWHVYDHL